MTSSTPLSQSHCVLYVSHRIALMDREIGTHPVHVKNVDVGRAQLLERIFNRDMHRLDVVAGVVRLLRDVVPSTLVVRGVLRNGLFQHCDNAVETKDQRRLTLVAMTIWSRMPRASIHSPMNCSDVSSW